jgi:hypothetical protein
MIIILSVDLADSSPSDRNIQPMFAWDNGWEDGSDDVWTFLTTTPPPSEPTLSPGENSLNRQLCNFGETVVVKKGRAHSVNKEHLLRLRTIDVDITCTPPVDIF